ncbi:Bug family tripartite tricarboxylate transporter substrate binding protein [Bordetella genomosp. 12]|uniref:LacI family transcriptional regulator n=1 Tax=Bordetella genomosp. 12 TaxID=463035 RepID=A0A261VBV7_9BORD|nr:tripartite tricarboxylate transporter substrate binding protein [Bordetella genomosp. 12]OZI71261.1 hypothetical protein CAL22_15520 [Bordetella genomosp. 12]
MKRLITGVLAACAFATLAPQAVAKPWPEEHPITIVVGFPAGSGLDVVTRQISDQLARKLGQSIVVENRAGAGGNISAEWVTRARPDGYTFLMTNLGVLAASPALYQNLSFDPAKDLDPVARVATSQLVAVTSPELQAKDTKAFLALAKANPGNYTYASGGNGAIQQLGTEMLKQQAGIDLRHVPYKGGAAAIPDLISNRVSLLIDGFSVTGPLIKTGKLRPLFTPSEQRNAQYPDVPTSAEVGLPDMLIYGWQGVLAPKGTSPEVIEKVSKALEEVLASPELKQRLEAQGAEAAYMNSADFAAFVAQERKRWGDLIQQAGITTN